MATIRTHIVTLTFLFVVFLSGIWSANSLNTDYGRLDVAQVSIPNEGRRISGLLYRPAIASNEFPVPAIVLAHGISGAKEYMSGIALELARRGFVALTIDEVGHGNSDGPFTSDAQDPTLGGLAAVRYLEQQPFVAKSAIGLVGHSMGAGVARATAVAHGNIAATVFIAGGIGEMVSDPVYGVLNSTFPKNLLVAVGSHDVLFNVDQLKKEWLPPVFGTSQPVAPSLLYGSFTSLTARKLITPPTIHLMEPVDPAVVSEVINWMQNSLQPTALVQHNLPETDLVYSIRELAIFASLVAFVGLTFPVSSLIFDYYQVTTKRDEPKTRHAIVKDWKVLVVWGLLSVLLFMPMMFVGLLMPFPPLVFGGSIAWWLLAVALLGLLVIRRFVPHSSMEAHSLRKMILQSFSTRGIMIAIALFAILYIIAVLAESFSTVNLRIIVPIFNDLQPIGRVAVFAMLIPFFFVFFSVEGLYLHEFRGESRGVSGVLSQVRSATKTVGIKTTPYIVILCVQYIPMYLLNFQTLPSFLGFVVEFFWLITPLFIVSTVCSWWFYEKTSTIGTAVIFNTLLYAWVSAALFPLGLA